MSKLKETKSKSMIIKDYLGDDFNKDDEDNIWQKAQSIAMYGVEQKDKFNHTEHIHFRVRPSELDVLGAVMEVAPKKWFKNNADLQRSVFHLGLFILLHIFKRTPSITSNEYESEVIEDLLKIIDNMHKLAKKSRLIELEKEMAELEIRVMKNKDPDRTNIVHMIDKWREKIIKGDL